MNRVKGRPPNQWPLNLSVRARTSARHGEEFAAKVLDRKPN